MTMYNDETLELHPDLSYIVVYMFYAIVMSEYANGFPVQQISEIYENISQIIFIIKVFLNGTRSADPPTNSR